ncbi:hypothetical protein [Paraburkholderia graminis]
MSNENIELFDEMENVYTVEDVDRTINVYSSDFGIYTEAKIEAMGFVLPSGLLGMDEQTEEKLKQFLEDAWVAADTNLIALVLGDAE